MGLDEGVVREERRRRGAAEDEVGVGEEGRRRREEELEELAGWEGVEEEAGGDQPGVGLLDLVQGFARVQEGEERVVRAETKSFGWGAGGGEPLQHGGMGWRGRGDRNGAKNPTNLSIRNQVNISVTQVAT